MRLRQFFERFSPLEVGAHSMLARFLDFNGVRPADLTSACIRELSEPALGEAKRMARANKRFGGKTSVRENLDIFLRNYALDIACILRGTHPTAMDIVDRILRGVPPAS